MSVLYTQDQLYYFLHAQFSHSLTELRDDVSTGDGRYKLVYAINGEIPSPNIVVFEDQIVRQSLSIFTYLVHTLFKFNK